MTDIEDDEAWHPDIPLGDFRVTVANRWGTLVPQVLTASSLREALSKAYALPIQRWFPSDPAQSSNNDGVPSAAAGDEAGSNHR